MDLVRAEGERPAKQARRQEMRTPAFGTPTTITVRSIGAKVDTPPFGIEQVDEADIDNVMRIMLSAYNMRADPPNGWSVEAERGAGQARGRTVTAGYAARLWGWDSGKLSFAELQTLRNSDPLILSLEIDLNFKSHDDEPWYGALLLRIESKQSLANKQRLSVHLNAMEATERVHDGAPPLVADAPVRATPAPSTPPPPTPRARPTIAPDVDDDQPPLPPSVLALAGVMPTQPPVSKKRGFLGMFGL